MNPTTYQRAACALLLVLSQACGSEMQDETLDDRLAEVEGELSRHHGVMMDAETLSEVVNEADRYHVNMMQIMDDMRGSMSDMPHCSDMGKMRDQMSDVSSEMHRHWSMLLYAGDLPSASTECAYHVTAMHDMLAPMHESVERSHCGMMGP